MNLSFRHTCGGNAHLVGQELVLGWNFFCCNRCEDSFYKWITKEFMEHLHKKRAF